MCKRQNQFKKLKETSTGHFEQACMMVKMKTCAKQNNNFCQNVLNDCFPVKYGKYNLLLLYL